MSKVNAKKTDSSAKTLTSTEKNKTAKWKRKNWMKEKFKRKKPPPKDQGKAKVQQTLPPKDVQQFSANWKTLQEVCQELVNTFACHTCVLDFVTFSTFLKIVHNFAKLCTDVKGQSTGEEASCDTKTSKW